jgi:hypothetical protein
MIDLQNNCHIVPKGWMPSQAHTSNTRIRKINTNKILVVSLLDNKYIDALQNKLSSCILARLTSSTIRFPPTMISYMTR